MTPKEGKPVTTYGQAALPHARREIGVKEHPAGSNDGPRVRVFRMGHPPEAWCADFGTWCLHQAGFPLPSFNWSFCPSWLAAARAGDAGLRILGAGERPQAGDIALYDWGGDGVPDHFGLIDRVTSATGFLAVEGNTSPTSDSNGGAVMLRSRRRDQCAAIIRTPQVPKASKPWPPPHGATLRLYIGGHPRAWAGWGECIGPMRNIARHGLDPHNKAWIAWRGGEWLTPRQVEGVVRRLLHEQVDG